MFARVSAWLRSHSRVGSLLVVLPTVAIFLYQFPGIVVSHIATIIYAAGWKASWPVWCWPLRNRGTTMYTQHQR
jgi:hypothetical protein